MRTILRQSWAVLVMSLPLISPARAAEAQFHPAVNIVFPRDPTQGQLVTISGSDLLPPTWTAKLQYKDKYGSGFHELTLSGSNSRLTFAAPANMRPDSLALQYTNSSESNELMNFIPQAERRITLLPILVQYAPDLFPSATTATGTGGTFQVLTAGTVILKGKNLRKVGESLAISARDPVPIMVPPIVTFAGAALSVSNDRYVRGVQDEITVSTSSVAHNTTGFMKVTASVSPDSERVTIVRPPQNARVFDASLNTPFEVTTGQLIRGRNYQIRGQQLVVQQRIGNLVNPQTPTLQIGNVNLSQLNTVNVQVPIDTMVFFSIPTTLTSVTNGSLVLSHAGGQIVLGTFNIINPPTPLNVSGIVVSPNDIIAGTAATVTVSLSPTPSNFSAAGSLAVTIPSSLASAIPAIPPVPITSNPVIFSLPTSIVQTTLSGHISVKHDVRESAVGGTASISVRPPRPTAVTVSPDTIPGSVTAKGSVSFDQTGPATVLLSSSDPSVLSVPASVTRSGSTASFLATTQPVTTPRSVTITAALNGVTATRSVTVAPGSLARMTASPSPVFAGEPTTGTLAFDVAVSGATVTFASSDTAIRVPSPITVTGTSRTVTFSTSPGLAAPASVTLTATTNGVARTAVVQVNPIQLAQFTVAPSSGASGATLAATLQLSRAAFVNQSVTFSSSDTTVAPAPNSLFIPAGSDVKVVSITLRPGQTAPKTATITASLHAGISSSPIIGSKTITVTVTP